MYDGPKNIFQTVGKVMSYFTFMESNGRKTVSEEKFEVYVRTKDIDVVCRKSRTF